MVDTLPHKKLALTAFLLTTIITFAFGLLPRGNFKSNWVEFDQTSNATWMGEYGYTIGQLAELTERTTDKINTRIDLSVIIQEQFDTTFRVLVYVGNECSSEAFIIGQWRTHLIVVQGCGNPSKSGQLRLSADMRAYLGTETTISVLLGKPNNQLLINNELVSEKSGSIYTPPSANNLSIIVGNTPNGQRGWSGLISALSILHVAEHGQLTKTIRDYQFGSYDGSGTIVDTSTANRSMRVPWPGRFPEQVRLAGTPVKSLFTTQRFDALINVVGFVPLGIACTLFLYSCFGLRNRALLVNTILVCCVVSLSIELSQVYIAGRKSNLHDLVLNGLGALLGYVVFCSFVAHKDRLTARSSTSQSTD